MMRFWDRFFVSAKEENPTSTAESERGQLGFLSVSFLSLAMVSFLDNARGPILPVICKSLHIPYETAGQFLMAGCLAAVLATFILGRCLKRWSERRLAIAVALLATIPGWFAPSVDSKTKLLLLGTLTGAAVSLISSMCSILTVLGSPPAKRGRFVAFQHVMYGLGSMTAPLLFTALSRFDTPWWWLLRASSWAFILLAIGAAWALPRSEMGKEEDTTSSSRINRWGLLVIVMFAFYVAGENLVSMWMTSLLVGQHGKAPAEASQYLTGFFIVLAGTRFLCFMFLRPEYEKPVLLVSLSFAIVFTLLGQQGHSWALPLVGVLGPFFPLCIARVSLQFPENWKQLTIFVFTGTQAMLAIMHVSVGSIADAFGIANAFLLSPAFLTISFGLLVIFLTYLKADSKSVN